MIVNIYIRQHIYRDFALSFLCLIGVVLCSGLIMAIRELGDWLTMPLALRFVMGQAPAMISIVFPIAFFLGVSLGLNRLVRKFEMVALFSLRYHRGHIIRAIFPVVLALSLVSGFISMVWKPIAQENFSEKMIVQQQEMLFKSIREGVIGTQSIPIVGEIVVSSSKHDDALYQAFISTNQSEGDLFILADEIKQHSDQPGAQSVVMTGMHLYQIDNQKQLSVQADESKFVVHLPISKNKSNIKNESTVRLLNHTNHSEAMSEIYKRVFPPISLFFLAGLAIVSFQIHPYLNGSKTGLLYFGVVLYYMSYLIVERVMQPGFMGLIMMAIPHVILLLYIFLLHRQEKIQ